jgi:energy-coupling factor transporter transmembrane protein EcfT
MLKRGIRNPWLRPFVLLFLCLLLGLVFVHAMHDGHDAITGIGAGCLAIAVFLSFTLIFRILLAPTSATLVVKTTRAPPRQLLALTPRHVVGVAGSPPLRL